MTPTQFRRALARAGLSQVAFSKILGVNPRTVRRWALGESPVPEYTHGKDGWVNVWEALQAGAR